MQVKGNVWSFGTEVKNQDKTIMFLTNDEFLSDKVITSAPSLAKTMDGTGKN